MSEEPSVTKYSVFFHYSPDKVRIHEIQPAHLITPMQSVDVDGVAEHRMFMLCGRWSVVCSLVCQCQVSGLQAVTLDLTG